MQLIVIPSQFEANGLLRRIRGRKPLRGFSFPCREGTLAGRHCVVAVIGMGLPHCLERTRLLIESLHPDTLLLAGFAGALNPDLPQGYLHHCPTGDSIHTVNHIVGTPEEKNFLWQNSKRPLLDMETTPLAGLCQKHQIPFSVLRIVSDTAGANLPTEVLRHSYDSVKGRTTPFLMAGHLFLHPGRILPLIRFLQPLGSLRDKLGEAIEKHFYNQT